MEQKTSPFAPKSPGQNAFKEAYDRLKAEADARKQGIGQDYSSAYQQLRGQSYAQGLGAAAQSGLSGGQVAGTQSQINAAQMGQLGNLMQGQERALREAKVGEASIYSNALLEGQQAQQMENERLNAISLIYGDKEYADLTPAQKQQLIGLGDRSALAERSKEQSGITVIKPFGTYYNNQANANKNKPEEKPGFTLELKKDQYGWKWLYRSEEDPSKLYTV
jgi:hypothetical protein